MRELNLLLLDRPYTPSLKVSECMLDINTSDPEVEEEDRLVIGEGDE